ncbi:MAG: hypothetical protein LUE15_01360, partial [Oscillospiraceae bacterium]|nr:hypothetical protein [Oscillospiraceae bacterium]
IQARYHLRYTRISALIYYHSPRENASIFLPFCEKHFTKSLRRRSAAILPQKKPAALAAGWG